MRQTRRNVLRKATALSALAVGTSGVVSAANCHGVPAWDETTLYLVGDRVTHDGSLWEATLASRVAEPSQSSAYWTLVGACGSGGGGNSAPTASFTTSLTTPNPGESVTFDASGSSDPDGSIASYSWNFGDGTTGSGVTASHSYSSAGDYTVTLTVTDDDGASDSASTVVSVSQPTPDPNQAPNASFTMSPASPTVGETTTFDATDSSDSDGTIQSYDWDFGDGSTGSGQSVTHSYSSPGDYTVTLTVTDDDGASDTNSTTVTVQSSGGGGGGGVDCRGYPAWQSSATYTGGDKVTYNGDLWKAKWWTRSEPGSGGEWGPWKNLGACGSGGGGGGGNESPMASFTTSPLSPNPGDQITFDATGSSDSDGTVTSYEWDFSSDGTVDATGQTVTHTYTVAGDYTVTLTVTDDAGATTTSTSVVSVGTEPSPPTDEFTVVGYYPGWKATPEYNYYPEDIPWNKVTDVLYAFLGVDEANGVPTIMSDLDYRNLDAIKQLKSGPAADTRVKISIGGWADSTGFSEVAASPSKRESFAQRSVEIMREYDLDGVDIDWEHPGANRGKCGCGTAEDPENQILLLQAIRDELDAAEAQDGRTYQLTIAAGGSDWNAALVQHRAVEQIVDQIYLMTYDFTGVWQQTAGLNAPIYDIPTAYPPGGDYLQYTLETSLIIWKEQGYWVDWMQWEPYGEPVEDPSSLVLGIPFYGRGCYVDNGIWDTFNLPDWQQGNPKYQNDIIPPGTWDELLGPDVANTGSFDFGDLEENYVGADGWEVNLNQRGQVPWLWNESEGTYISFDDPASVAEKVQFAKDEGLGGVMFWELAQDWNETLLDTINANV